MHPIVLLGSGPCYSVVVQWGRALVSVIGYTCARELEPVSPAGGNRELDIKNADVTSPRITVAL